MWVVPSDAPARMVEFAREVPYVPPVLPPPPRPRSPFRALRAKVSRAAASAISQATWFDRLEIPRVRSKAPAPGCGQHSISLGGASRPSPGHVRPFPKSIGNFLSKRCSCWANEGFVVLGVAVAGPLVAARSVTFRTIGWLKHVRAYVTIAGQARHRLRVMGYSPSPSELLDELLVTRRSHAIPHLTPLREKLHPRAPRFMEPDEGETPSSSCTRCT